MTAAGGADARLPLPDPSRLAAAYDAAREREGAVMAIPATSPSA